VKILFIHQNFPGQFRHIAHYLAQSDSFEVASLGDHKWVKSKQPLHPKIRPFSYLFQRPALPNRQERHYLGEYEEKLLRGQQVAHQLEQILKSGFRPDCIVYHGGWGEGMFLKHVCPDARLINYCEFFYQTAGADIGFDPEYPGGAESRFFVHVRNNVLLAALTEADLVITPTLWQKSLIPKEFQAKVCLVHEGINTTGIRPGSSATVLLNSQRYSTGEQIVTFATRRLEPYRGFHRFMRALPDLQARLPNARFVIAGHETHSYGPAPSHAKTYKEQFYKELKNKVAWERVNFVGALPFSNYLALLQVSAAHVYFTYPFILSWSMLESMAAGCLVIGSRTPPVEEVIKDDENGLLVGFFDQKELVDAVTDVVMKPEAYSRQKQKARETIVENYDLHNTLAAWHQAIKSVA